MGGKAWENVQTESLIGILKNEYINCENMDKPPCKSAIKMLSRWIYLFDCERPHGWFNKKMKPTELEIYANGLREQYKPKYKINY